MKLAVVEISIGLSFVSICFAFAFAFAFAFVLGAKYETVTNEMKCFKRVFSIVRCFFLNSFS